MKKFTDKIKGDENSIQYEGDYFDLVSQGSFTWTHWKRDILTLCPVLTDQDCVVLERRRVSIWGDKMPYDESITGLMSTYNPMEINAHEASISLMKQLGLDINAGVDMNIILRENMAHPMTDCKIVYGYVFLGEDEYSESKVIVSSGDSEPIKIPFDALKSIRIDDLVSKNLVNDVTYHLKENGFIF